MVGSRLLLAVALGACGSTAPAPSSAPAASRELAAQELATQELAAQERASQEPASQEPPAQEPPAQEPAQEPAAQEPASVPRAQPPAPVEPAPAIGMAELAPADALDAAIRARVAAGDVPGATSALSDALAIDLPRFRRALATEDTLSALRDGEGGAALRARIDRLEAAWREAARAGVPALAYRAGRQPWLRAGIYLPDARRFLPVGEPQARTFAVLVAPQVERVVVLTQHGTGGYAGRPNLAATMVPFHGEGPRLAHTTPSEANELAVAALADGMPLRVALEGVRRASWWQHSEGREPVEVPASQPMPHPYLFVRGPALLRDPYYDGDHLPDIDGVRRGGPLAGWRVQGNRLERPDAAPIALGAGHSAHGRHNLVPNGDASVVLVVSNRDYPSCAHVVDRVEVASGTVTRLGAGRGLAAAAYAPDGTLLLQLGAVVRRYPAGGGEGEPILDGILLASPLGCP